ncbi:hypothetical protein OHB44_27830 [Micromonospora sp. NBC_00821]|uniref:hypothetical protein n=1 Tax=Micromonospora sp. NBC_00821 TaxID=2975977 RepID=UPI002ED51F7B|nr:hypothetical protein OHB44_27830 [Micromonospora sp. NBC_00821]
MLASALCTAVLFTASVITLAVVEEVRDARPVSITTMHLLTAATATSWIALILVACRDRLARGYRALRGSTETMQARQLELYRRQDHLYDRFLDLANRQVEQMQMLRGIAEDITLIRKEMADVIGVADADAELLLRQAVNGHRPQASGGLYVVPPEG